MSNNLLKHKDMVEVGTVIYLSFLEPLMEYKIVSGKIIITTYVEYKYTLVGFLSNCLL